MSIPTNLNPLGLNYDDSMPLTFIATEANSSVKLTATGNPTISGLQYKVKGGSWTHYTIDEVISLDSVNDYVQFQNTEQQLSISVKDYVQFAMSGKIAASGNIQSLLNYIDYAKVTCFFSLFNNCSSLITAPDLPSKILGYYCYGSMFQNCNYLTVAPELPATNLAGANTCYGDMFNGCSRLINAPNLPATTLSNGCYWNMFKYCVHLTTTTDLPATTLTQNCYRGMFSGCKSLTDAPDLPATTLAASCYDEMFKGCKSLVNAPALPATTLANYCYRTMFEKCSSLISAPELPATTLAISCYASMFYDCTSLTTAPELPATTLATYCYQGMFRGCTSLVNAPALSATTLATECYERMYQDCTSLVTTPALPATTLTYGCYYEMFRGCTSLVTAPELPATTLADSCYIGMFGYCSSLVNPPELPATTLAPKCYWSMFSFCTALTTAPELPAATMTQHCYHYMFNGASSMSNVEVLLSNWDNSNSQNWLNNVASSGTFYCPAELKIPSRDANGVPSGWNIYPKDVQLGQIIEENGVQKFGILSFDGVISTIDSTETFENVYSYNLVNSPTHAYKRKLSYLQSTGTQYINTGVSPDFVNGDEIEITFYKPSYSIADKVLFGSRKIPAMNGVYAVPFGIVVADNQSYTIAVTIPNTAGEFKIHVNDSVIILNDVSYSMPKRVTCDYQMYLFALNNGGSVLGIFDEVKIYDWKYYHNGVLAQHLIPVLDNNDVPCLYDEVNEEFFYNSGTGIFNYGELPQLNIIQLGQIISENGVKYFAEYTFDGKTPSIESVNTFDNVYTYNRLNEDSLGLYPAYFTLRALSDNSSVELTQPSGSVNISQLYCKTKNSDWTLYEYGDKINLNEGEYVQFYNHSNQLSTSNSNYVNFSLSGEIEALGNIQSLINFSEDAPAYCFRKLFQNCKSLVKAPIVLPAKHIYEYAYGGMFSKSNITNMPKMEANQIKSHGCFYMFEECPIEYGSDFLATSVNYNGCAYMFVNCTSLKSFGEIHATDLIGTNQFQSMFSGCTNLITGPSILPATIPQRYSYMNMFENCSKLEKAPILPMTQVYSQAYKEMFKGCSSIKEYQVAFTDWPTNNGTQNWVQNARNNSDVIFRCPEALDTTTKDNSHVLSDWTIIKY